MLRDPGAVRELAASLAEGLRAHVADVTKRVPGASVLLQLDEPSLPAVLAGTVPTESGFGALRAVEESTAQDTLAGLVSAAGVPVIVHCCAADVPVRLIKDAGAAALALDLDLVGDLDSLGEAVDGGLGLVAGAVAAGTTAPAAADRIRDLWHRLGFPADRLAAQVVVSSACGLAGLTADRARAVLTACREAGRRLRED